MKKLVYLLLGLMCALASGCQYTDVFFNVKKADKLYKNGKKQEAEKILSKLRAEYPEDPLVNYDLGAVKQAMNLDPGLYYDIAQTGKGNKLRAFAHYNQGNFFLKSKKYNNAIKQYEKALLIDPNFLDARYNLELALKLKKKEEKRQKKQKKENNKQCPLNNSNSSKQKPKEGNSENKKQKDSEKGRKQKEKQGKENKSKNSQTQNNRKEKSQPENMRDNEQQAGSQKQGEGRRQSSGKKEEQKQRESRQQAGLNKKETQKQNKEPQPAGAVENKGKRQEGKEKGIGYSSGNKQKGKKTDKQDAQVWGILNSISGDELKAKDMVKAVLKPRNEDRRQDW